MFSENGYDGTSIEQVLESTMASRGSLYYHFASKEALFEAVLEDTEASVARALWDAARAHQDPYEGLRAGCSAFLRLARTATVRQIILIDAPTVVGWKRWREIDSQYAFGMMRSAVDAIAPPAKDGFSPDMTAHLLLASLLELAMIVAWAAKPRVALRESQAALDQLLERLLR